MYYIFKFGRRSIRMGYGQRGSAGHGRERGLQRARARVAGGARRARAHRRAAGVRRGTALRAAAGRDIVY